MSTQSSLNLSAKQTGPVECLGQTFPSEDARREHYLNLLAQKLKDPDFRKIDGFPIGEDEDILALSDPPYYTACPNPWIGDFIKHYGRPYDPKGKYHREPFAADVSEGKIILFTTRTPIIPRFRTVLLCAISSITHSLGMSCLTVSAGRA